MRRRTLLTTFAGAIGGSLAFSTGAFSSSRAERSITTEVVDDSEAYLRIDTNAVGVAGRSSQVNLGYGGKVASFRIPGPEDDLIGGTDPQGVGTESEYWFSNLAVIQNQGTEPIVVYSSYDGNLEHIALVDCEDQSSLLDSKSEGRELTVGESFIMGLYIETGDGPAAEYDETIGIIGEVI